MADNHDMDQAKKNAQHNPNTIEEKLMEERISVSSDKDSIKHNPDDIFTKLSPKVNASAFTNKDSRQNPDDIFAVLAQEHEKEDVASRKSTPRKEDSNSKPITISTSAPMQRPGEKGITTQNPEPGRTR